MRDIKQFTIWFPEHFGQRLKTVRMARCLPQRSFSAAVGLGQTSLSNVEMGKFVPAEPAVREAIIRESGVRWDWLMSGSGLPFQLEEGIEILNPCRKHDQQQAAVALIASIDCHLAPFLLDLPARFLAFQFRPKLFYVLLLGAMTPLRAPHEQRRIKDTIQNFFKPPQFLQLSFSRKSILDEAKRTRKDDFKIGDAFTLKYLVRHTDELMRNRVSEESVRMLKNEVDLHLDKPEFVRDLRALTEKFRNR